MLHFYNKRLFALAVCALLNLTTYQTDARSKKQDPIVGANALNFTLWVGTPNPTNVFGVSVYNADGTWVIHGSEFLTQQFIIPLGSGIPSNGAFSTIATGTWKKIGKNRYKSTGSFVNLARGIDCATGQPTGDLSAPACPLLRWKVEFTTNLNLDGSGTFAGTAVPHPIDNLALDLPAPAPFTGLVNQISGRSLKVDVCS